MTSKHVHHLEMNSKLLFRTRDFNISQCVMLKQHPSTRISYATVNRPPKCIGQASLLGVTEEGNGDYPKGVNDVSEHQDPTREFVSESKG